MKRIFVMELDNKEDSDVVADDLGISLHALTSLSGVKTMQLLLSIAGTTLHALVDSRSTRTFIHDAVVHCLGLEITYKPSLSVCVANEEHMLWHMQWHGAIHSSRNISRRLIYPTT
jgi:hypothetical protein